MSQNGARADHRSRFLRSKGRAQEYVAASGLAWTVLRPSVIFGPQDEFFNALARFVRLTPVVFPLIGGGKALFQPVSVHDVAEAVSRSLDDGGAAGRTFDLGGPEVLDLAEIERRILRSMRARRLLINAPVALLKPAVWAMERLLPGTPVNLTLLELLQDPNVVEDNALTRYFGLAPRAFAGDEIGYLRDATALQALRRFLTGANVN
jgi:NADH dehydrogenase